MNPSLPQTWLIWHVALAGIAIACMLAMLPRAAGQQPCNPVVDGTYCATQMPKAPQLQSRSQLSLSPIQDIGSAISLSPSSAGTLGGISFRGGSTCIGLMRRGQCN